MTSGEKAILIWVASMAGLGLLLIGAGIWLPTLLEKRARMLELQTRLVDRRTLETEGKAFLRSIQDRVGEIEEKIRQIKARLEKETFSSPSESVIPAFIEELQTMLVRPGNRLLDLSYQPRTVERGFVTFSFEARLEGTYEAFRHLLHLLESHPGRIRIDQLTFQTFDNEHHRLEYKVACSVRFVQHGK